VGDGHVQAFELGGLVEGKTDEDAPAHSVERVVGDEWIV
jgi:hypothetical protein